MKWPRNRIAREGHPTSAGEVRPWHPELDLLRHEIQKHSPEAFTKSDEVAAQKRKINAEQWSRQALRTVVAPHRAQQCADTPDTPGSTVTDHCPRGSCRPPPPVQLRTVSGWTAVRVPSVRTIDHDFKSKPAAER